MTEAPLLVRHDALKAFTIAERTATRDTGSR